MGIPAVSSTSSCRSKSQPSMCGLRRATLATGLVSVIPQPWMMRTPWAFQNHSMRERGTADPPHRKARREDMSASGCSSRYCLMPNITVGTPAENVTPSEVMSGTRPAALRSGPG